MSIGHNTLTRKGNVMEQTKSHRTTIIFKGVSKSVVQAMLKHNVPLTSVMSTLMLEALKNNRLLELAKIDLDVEEFDAFREEIDEIKRRLASNY